MVRLVPGAVLAMVMFVASATGLRVYIAVLTSTGYTYGALATPIAFLLFAFLLGLSVVLGAHLNNAVEQAWPSRPEPAPRRMDRLLAMTTHPGVSAVDPDLPAAGPANHAAGADLEKEPR